MTGAIISTPTPEYNHAHGYLASEIVRDPAFPTRYDRTEDSCGVLRPDSVWLWPRGSADRVSPSSPLTRLFLAFVFLW